MNLRWVLIKNKKNKKVRIYIQRRTVFWGGYFKGKENIMTEIGFLKLYKNKRKLKNIKEAKEKLKIFWDIIFTGIALEKK